ncbi:beta-ketoacyl synthase N-terminal-like domain-containing protein [Streptomyces sp. R28]|uniref:Beta-ketoacyl synthase N-terminal-like domain-containing protein n=1 Tax=Streptomyces sp. R28 TaxID=3238628 RepID=A0AB39QEN1_9ACTN
MENIYSNWSQGEVLRTENAGLGFELAFLASRVSHKLNLTGPSIPVQTACSTSLVAVHTACQSLLAYECDMALSGAVAYKVPENRGYLHQEGSFLSPDGHVRPFDAQARGTVFGNGVGVVVLKRLEDALADGTNHPRSSSRAPPSPTTALRRRVSRRPPSPVRPP